MSHLTKEIERLEALAEKLSEAYRRELETEMRAHLGRELNIDCLFCLNAVPIEDSYFNIKHRRAVPGRPANSEWSEDWTDVGHIFPLRKTAYCMAVRHIKQDEDPVLKCMKEVLEKRGYSVDYKPERYNEPC